VEGRFVQNPTVESCLFERSNGQKLKADVDAAMVEQGLQL
jgi:hypothetical protein